MVGKVAKIDSKGLPIAPTLLPNGRNIAKKCPSEGDFYSFDHILKHRTDSYISAYGGLPMGGLPLRFMNK